MTILERIMHLYIQAEGAAESAPSTADSLISALAAPIAPPLSKWDEMGQEWLQIGINFALKVVLALVLFFAGRYLIGKVTALIRKLFARRQLDGVAISLLDSLIVALLYIALGLIIATAVGIESTSFAAVLASMGLAIGMALSGQLQNLAGGVIILLTKPFTTGQVIEAQGVVGTVRSVSLFHTLVVTADNKVIFVPNGLLSSGLVTNYTHSHTRRIEWQVCISYGADVERVRQVLWSIVEGEGRILSEPTPFVALLSMDDSAVRMVVRGWTKTEDHWDVFFHINERIYAEFNRLGIEFPFPQLTVHQAKN